MDISNLLLLLLFLNQQNTRVRTNAEATALSKTTSIKLAFSPMGTGKMVNG